MGHAKIYGYGLAAICLIFAAARAPGLTHHQHWKAALIWGVIAIVVAAGTKFILDKRS
jgi:hypothetical protein